MPGEAGLRCAQHQPTDSTYPVAFAIAASATDADPRAIALAFAFSWAENMVQAAIKSVPLGQSAGQRILARLAHAIPAAVESALLDLAKAAEGNVNVLPLMKEALRLRATVGEVCHTLRGVWGIYRPVERF